MKIFVLQVIFLIIFNISFGHCRTRSRYVDDNYFDAELYCLHHYALRIGSITKQVKADSLSCLNKADIRFGSDKMFEILHNPLKKCFSAKSIKDYFKCIENIAPENRKKLKEITLERELFLQNIDKMKQNKTACLRKASSKGNYESTNAVFSFNNCLQSIPKQEINSVKEPILVENPSPPGDMNEFLNQLDVIKELYSKLKNCTLEKNYSFHDCFRGANIIYDLRDRFASNSTEYFSKITEIDEADESCLRQYVVMNLNEKFEFDLESCLMHGYKQSQESEENLENDKKLIADLIKEYKEINKCRDVTEDLNIYKCVYDKINFFKLKKKSNLRVIQAAISKKSERNFKSFKTTFLSSYTDQYPCIENLYDALQFEGYNLSPMQKNVLYTCLEKGYKNTATLPLDEKLIKELNEIQDFLKTCTEHPKSPGYKRCFENIIIIYDTTQHYLEDKNANYSEIVSKHDMLHDTCFADIVRDITGRTFLEDNSMLSQKCLFP